MADNWMLGESAALDDYIPTPPSNMLGNAATAVKDWWTNQPSWLDRAQAENQRTSEAFQRGGMGEIAKQLATDTTEAQDLAAGFGGNIKGVKPPVAPGALAAIGEYRPPFYSAVEQAVQEAKQNAAPGQQWAGFLRNQPGVKPEEVEALKLGRLFEQPGSVPKEAVLGEIAANRVNVGEVMKGDLLAHDVGAQRIEPIGQHGLQYLRTSQDIADAARHNPQFRESIKGMSEAEIFAAAERLREAQKFTPTKFSQYTLPGGENYREMLLTLPTQKSSTLPDFIGYYRQRFPNSGATDAMIKEYWEKGHTIPTAGSSKSMADPAVFKSSHYDEPNILAHVRYNDRVIDGKKTLFVEEVQSDWHQKGKREGYKEPYKVSELSEVPTGDPVASDPSRFWYVRAPDNVFQIAKQHTPTFQDAVDYIVREKSKGGGTVPDAPFKTTWPELAMKRIIREAAEKGYDKVAWTPGSVQASRYDLSKHVKEIEYIKRGDNAYELGIADINGQGVPLPTKFMTLKDIEEIVGKEIAEKISKGEGTKFRGHDGYTLSGLDLKVGGEGMKGFYDEILPATVNRLVKKHGGKVGEGKVVEENQKLTLDTVATDMGFGGWHSGLTAAQKEMVEARWAQRKKFGKETPVHSLDITPSLRAAAMKGFPLFTAGGVAATGIMGEMARQDDYRQ